MSSTQLFEKLFETGYIGSMKIRNRIVLAPMRENYFETSEPIISRRLINFLGARAKGGVGLLIEGHVKVESAIDPYPVHIQHACLDQGYVARGLSELTEEIHKYGAKIALQVSAGGGRNTTTIIPGKWPKAPSRIPIRGHPDLLTDELTIGEIEGLIEAYGKAAEVVQRVGFDAIQVHCYAGYLMDQFLTPCWNKREDKYGKDWKGRMQFVLDCITSVRSRVGKDFPIIVRLTSDHRIEDGRSLEETINIARVLQDAGVHCLHLTAACYDALQWGAPCMYFKQGCNVPFAEPIKRAVTIPAIIDGKIADPKFAEALLRAGKADFIGLARALIADPEWPKKAFEGRTDDILRCIYCNMGCVGRLYDNKYMSCTVNPQVGKEKEYEILPASKPKKVLVIGGGPGGMEAARVAARRGHKVTLYEKNNQLGGNLIVASVPSFKGEIRSLLNWLQRQIRDAGVKIELGKTGDAKTVDKLKPDTVVIATGSTPLVEDIPGIKLANVHTQIDVLLGKADVKGKVIVLGGDTIACETALFLAQKRCQVIILATEPDIALDTFMWNRVTLLEMLNEKKVVSLLNASEITKIAEGGVAYIDKDGKTQFAEADFIVLARGMIANNNLYEELKGKVPELYLVGDCVRPRTILEAMHEGFFVGNEI